MFLNYVPILCWLCVLMLLCRAWSRLRTTTLTTACAWGIGAACVGLTAAVVAVSVGPERTGWSDLAWYATAVTLLCPGVAVLGARRPGAGAWGFFVLVPLLLVLAWPALAARRVISIGVPLELETPAVMGFAVVLIMAFGNWVGTRFTRPSVFYAAGVLLLLIPTAVIGDMAPDWIRDRQWGRLAGSFLLAFSVLQANALASVAEPAELDVFDRLWRDFSNTFGTVWARRVADRINQSAAHEKWSATLDWHGFEWQAECSEEDIDRTRERIEHTLRWLLKRFVDTAWVDQRLLSKDNTADE